MFKHLVDKPSAQTVSDIIKNAVEIEQVTPACTDRPPRPVFQTCQPRERQNTSVFFHHYGPAVV